MRWLLFIVALALLLGCISQPEVSEDKNISGEVKIVKEENKTIQEEKEVNEENDDFSYDVMDYINNPDAPLSIRFYDVGYGGKNGRLIMISKEDFNAVIYSVPHENYQKGISYLASNADDVELLIIPSEINADDVSKLIKAVNIGKVVLPDFESERINEIESMFKSNGIEVIKAKNGDLLKYNGITFKFIAPFPDDSLSGANNNAIIMLLQDRNFSFLFLTDAVDGEIQKVNAYVKLEEVNGVEAPNYGMDITPGPVTLLFDKIKPKFIVVDGYKEDVSAIGTDARQFFEEYARIKKIGLFKVWNNGTRINYDGVVWNVS